MMERISLDVLRYSSLNLCHTVFVCSCNNHIEPFTVKSWILAGVALVVTNSQKELQIWGTRLFAARVMEMLYDRTWSATCEVLEASPTCWQH